MFLHETKRHPLFPTVSKDKKRAREARKAAKTAKDGDDDKDDDDSDGEPQMSETNGNTCFLKGLLSHVHVAWVMQLGKPLVRWNKSYVVPTQSGFKYYLDKVQFPSPKWVNTTSPILIRIIQVIL